MKHWISESIPESCLAVHMCMCVYLCNKQELQREYPSVPEKKRGKRREDPGKGDGWKWEHLYLALEELEELHEVPEIVMK